MNYSICWHNPFWLVIDTCPFQLLGILLLVLFQERQIIQFLAQSFLIVEAHLSHELKSTAQPKSFSVWNRSLKSSKDLDLVSKMQILGLLVAILIVSCGATDVEVEEEERAVVQGFHCDYLMYLLPYLILILNSHEWNCIHACLKMAHVLCNMIWLKISWKTFSSQYSTASILLNWIELD